MKIFGKVYNTIFCSYLILNFGNRSYAIPKKSVNLAFSEQIVEIFDNLGRDAVFTREYFGRYAMEAVYVLADVSALHGYKGPEIDLL